MGPVHFALEKIIWTFSSVPQRTGQNGKLDNHFRYNCFDLKVSRWCMCCIWGVWLKQFFELFRKQLESPISLGERSWCQISREFRKYPALHEDNFQTFEVLAEPGSFYVTGEVFPCSWEGMSSSVVRLPLMSSLFLGLYFLHLPLLPIQTHWFTTPRSECFELCRQNISVFDKEISIFIRGHIQVTAYGVIIVPSLHIYLPWSFAFETITFSQKKTLKWLVGGGLRVRAFYCRPLHHATWMSQPLFRLRSSRHRSSVENIFSKHLVAGKEWMPQFRRMSPIWFYLCLVFRELASSLITLLALPCDLTFWYQGLVFAFSVPTPFVFFFWPHCHRPLAEAGRPAVPLRQGAALLIPAAASQGPTNREQTLLLG